MTNDTITALIVTIPSIILAVATLVVSLKNNQKANTIIGKADEIHTLTNSNLTNVKEALEIANTKIENLEKTILKNKI